MCSIVTGAKTNVCSFTAKNSMTRDGVRLRRDSCLIETEHDGRLNSKVLLQMQLYAIITSVQNSALISCTLPLNDGAARCITAFGSCSFRFAC